MYGLSSKLPAQVKVAIGLAFLAANLQAFTGIITVLRQAPPPEALTHQFCSLILLTSALFMVHSLRRPNKNVLRGIETMKRSVLGHPQATIKQTTIITTGHGTIKPGHFDRSATNNSTSNKK